MRWWEGWDFSRGLDACDCCDALGLSVPEGMYKIDLLECDALCLSALPGTSTFETIEGIATTSRLSSGSFPGCRIVANGCHLSLLELSTNWKHIPISLHLSQHLNFWESRGCSSLDSSLGSQITRPAAQTGSLSTAAGDNRSPHLSIISNRQLTCASLHLRAAMAVTST